MQREVAIQQQRPRAIGIATALMCALAGGAIWCLLSLYSRSDLAVFAFIVALPVVWTLRSHGYAGRSSGALIAAVCVALASAYSFYLQAVAQIASLLGLSMRATLLQMEPGMAIAIARANLSGWNAAIVGVAVVLAIALMLRAGALQR
ncbi:hypothetical protein [Dokdonella soli]|uniref:Uncharacterized protein n=2 Tax=Dokdonella soli TaxID=529810 RepID=A0ABN1IWZ8_9GAMM